MCARGCGWTVSRDPEESTQGAADAGGVSGGQRGCAGAALLRDAAAASDGAQQTVVQAIRAERKRLDPIRNVADIVLDTTKFNVHELRAHINAQFERGGERRT